MGGAIICEDGEDGEKRDEGQKKKKIAESVFGIMAGNRTKGGKTGK